MKRSAVLGTEIDRISLTGAVEQALALMEQRRGAYVVTPNTEIVLSARKDPELRNALDAADLSLCDGIGVLIASRIIGDPISERIAVKTHEYTEESTGSLLNPYTGKYLYSLIDKLDLPKCLFKDISLPGAYVGELLPEIQKEIKGNCKVILCASHDTASAFESVEIDDNSVLISSGTWSLLGIKSLNPIVSEESYKANYTNEGGVGYIRFLKNIMGMWINNRIKIETGLSQEFIDKNIDSVDYKVTFDVNDESLLAPESMKKAILKLLEKCPPQNDLEIFASIYRSMAKCYKKAIDELEKIVGRCMEKVVIIGGGAKNIYLNKLVEEYTNKKVIAMPIEATALGNIKIQMKASKEL